MNVKLYDKNPDIRIIDSIVDCLKTNKIGIYPTDTIYAVGCSLQNQRGKEQITRILNKPDKWSEFSLICADLSHVAQYTRPLPNHIFKLLKKNLPGPFTFILEANNKVPKIFKHKKKTIGIRIPDNNIITQIVHNLGCPIVGSSIHDDDNIIEYSTDPELIYEKYEHCIDFMVDGGFGGNIASTVVDCSNGSIEIIRQGAGTLLE